MARAIAVAVTLVALFGFARAAIPGDEVTSLPGVPGGSMTSKQYSGYLSISGGLHLHYWLVMSESNPSTDPLTLWLNGGPGCSSLEGYMYENGPYHVIEPIELGPDGVPKLYLNPNRWNMNSNMLFLEMPAGVGFSYADSPSGYRFNDTSQAVDNFEALGVFFAGFPELKANDFYITGESYAGMYVPTLALQILNHNKAGTSDINLKGIMVGNGVIGQGAQNSLPILSDFLFGHGLYSQVTHDLVTKECGDFAPPLSKACQAAFLQASDEVSKINIYDIYQPCINSGFKPAPEHMSHYYNPLNNRVKRRPLGEFEEKVYAAIAGPVECIDAGAGSVYLNEAAVRSAIHVKSQAQIGNWTVCTNKIQYEFTMGSLLPYYKNDLIPNIRVVIYNGDVDSCVPYNGNELWTSSLDIPVKESWRAWFVNKQVAGYATTYESNFQFVTVKGSGHMVPQFRPVQALALFQHFVNDTPF